MKQIKIKNKELFILVDDMDFDFLNQYSWNEAKRGNISYAITGSGNNKILMHRLILNVQDSKIHVDHINHNGLDNQKSNLRLCNNQENHFNQRKRKNTSSKYKGVYWNKSKRKWQVSVKDVNTHKTISLGRYENEIDAANKYNEYALKYFGKFAKLNKL